MWETQNIYPQEHIATKMFVYLAPVVRIGDVCNMSVIIHIEDYMRELGPRRLTSTSRFRDESPLNRVALQS